MAKFVNHDVEEKWEKFKLMHLLHPFGFVVLQLLFLCEILLTIVVWNRMETASSRMCNLRHNANRL